MPLKEILDELEKQTNFSRAELVRQVEAKYNELLGLVSKEGAAYLVARSLGINLETKAVRRLEMKNILPGMKRVSVIGRVFRISPINEFERLDGRKSKVVNLWVADNTGYVRLSLWDDQVKLIEDETIKLGDIIQIDNGFARENIFGDVEISLSKFGSIKQVEDPIEIPELDELIKKFLSFTPERIEIKDSVPGNFEFRATIVHVFRGSHLFDICPICGNSLEKNICTEHGEVTPNKAIVLSCIIDDGTDSLRTVFFRESAEKLIGTDASELSSLEEEKRHELVKEKLLGREVVLAGRVKKNKIFDRLELVVDVVKDLNVCEESKKLVEEIELKVDGYA